MGLHWKCVLKWFRWGGCHNLIVKISQMCTATDIECIAKVWHSKSKGDDDKYKKRVKGIRRKLFFHKCLRISFDYEYRVWNHTSRPFDNICNIPSSAVWPKWTPLSPTFDLKCPLIIGQSDPVLRLPHLSTGTNLISSAGFRSTLINRTTKEQHGAGGATDKK